MLMYNLIEYSDSYSDTSGSLWQFKRDEIERDEDLTVNAQHIPRSIWRSLEMPLINCKVSLRSYENYILSSARTAATFAITDTKLYVPVVTLKTEDNAKLSKH